MRIHRLELINVRGIEHLALDELPETGVVVIHGENEAGKSTIVEALDVVLTEKHSGRSKRIRALQPVGKDVAPEVTAELSVGEYRFRIAKRWLSKKSCELNVTAPRPEQFTGSQADDELERILAEHLDRSLVDALFMRQDDTGEAISAVGIPSLTRALERESGLAEDEVSGDDSALLARVDKEYQRYFTAAKGNPAGEYKDAAAALARAEEEYTEATRVLRELDSVVERYEQLEREQAPLKQSSPPPAPISPTNRRRPRKPPPRRPPWTPIRPPSPVLQRILPVRKPPLPSAPSSSPPPRNLPGPPRPPSTSSPPPKTRRKKKPRPKTRWRSN